VATRAEVKDFQGVVFQPFDAVRKKSRQGSAINLLEHISATANGSAAA
jgi:hypothetical protein